MASAPAQVFKIENAFYRKVALTMGLLMLAGFGLFSALGLTDVTVMPRSAHLHGIIMFAWVVLFIAQNFLGTRPDLSLHRKLGWFGVALATVGVVTAWNTGLVTTSLDRAPPVFYPPYFLALNLLTPVFFAGFLGAAIRMRRQTAVHRRLMLGAIIMVTEPPIGRLTIIALVGGMGGPDIAIPYFAANQWIIPMVEMGLQMLIVAVIMLRDRAIRGSVHKVLWYVLAGVPLLYAAIWGLAAVPAFADFVFSLKGSAL